MTTNLAKPPCSPGARRRRLVVALSLVGTEVALLASEALDPVGDGTADNLVAAGATQEPAMVASSLLLLLSAVLLVPAIGGILRMVPDRGSGLGATGALLLTLGAFGHAMAALFYLVVSAMPGGPWDRAELVALVDHLNTSPNIVVAFVFIMSFGVGSLLAFIGLRRAGAIPTWVLAAVIAASAIELLAPGGILGLAVLKQALGVVAFGYLAIAFWQATGPTTAARAGGDAEMVSAR